MEICCTPSASACSTLPASSSMDWPGSPYMRSRLIFAKPAACASCTACRASAARWIARCAAAVHHRSSAHPGSGDSRPGNAAEERPGNGSRIGLQGEFCRRTKGALPYSAVRIFPAAPACGRSASRADIDSCGGPSFFFRKKRTLHRNFAAQGLGIFRHERFRPAKEGKSQ